MKNKPKIIIIGAGPGGLSAAMLLAHQGFEVKVFEKASQPGGRTSELKLGEYKFDVGPTFFMMKYVLDEIFEQIGKNSSDYIDFIRLSPMYRLQYGDRDNYMNIYEQSDLMEAELKRVFPDEVDGLKKFRAKEKKRFDYLMPLLLHHNNNIFEIFSRRFFRAIPSFSIGSSVYDTIGRYFKNPLTRLSFTFQAKYLGMSPWTCPGAFGIVPYIEHAFGIYHVRGGLFQLSRAMAKAAQEQGADIIYNSLVKRIIIEGGKFKGVLLENGDKEYGDEVVINADFGYAMNNLVSTQWLKKYSPKKISKKKFSCSIFMMYLGIKKQYGLEHNTIVLAKDYKKNIGDVFAGRITSGDISIYVRDATKEDSGMAPAGKSALYVLVPVPNNSFGIDWQQQVKNLRKYTIDVLKYRMGMEDIEDQIEVEKIYTPNSWEQQYNVHQGAVFNLGHNLGQMMWFRPHNKFEEIDNCYLVGGGTHPGSGLPTIYHSGRIAAGLISDKYNRA